MSADEVKEKFRAARLRAAIADEIAKLVSSGKVSKALALKRESDFFAVMGHVIPLRPRN